MLPTFAAKLRSQIDALRQERCRHDEIYTRLEHEVLGQAEKMGSVLEKGKKILKLRDKAIAQLEAANKQLEEGTR